MLAACWALALAAFWAAVVLAAAAFCAAVALLVALIAAFVVALTAPVTWADAMGTSSEAIAATPNRRS
jgi:hypothetical protein